MPRGQQDPEVCAGRLPATENYHMPQREPHECDRSLYTEEGDGELSDTGYSDMSSDQNIV